VWATSWLDKGMINKCKSIGMDYLNTSPEIVEVPNQFSIETDSLRLI